MQILDRMSALEDLAPEWHALWERDPAASVFQSPEWLLPWTRRIWGGGKLRIAVRRRAGQLDLVVPLFVWGDGRVAWLGSGISDYLGVTAAPETAADAAPFLFDVLEEIRGEWSECSLEELREDSPVLRAGAPSSFDVRIEECSVCPVRCLNAALPARLAKNLRYAERRLGAFDMGQGCLEDLIRLHALRWGGEGMLRCPHIQQFHREALSRHSRLYALRVDGRTIAVQYNFLAKGRACYYLSGYDPEWAAFSPGSVLLKRSMDEAAREGAREFDFLRNPEPYKYTWGAADRINRRMVLTPRH